jgi:methyl-accepting chemotaxis protein
VEPITFWHTEEPEEAMHTLAARIRDTRIGAKLVVLLVAVGLAPMAVVGALGYLKASRSLDRDAGKEVAELAFNASDKLDRNLFERYGDVQAFAKSDAARSMDPARLQAWMDTMMGTYTPIYNLMVVADAKGKIVAANTVDRDGEPLDTSGLVGRDVSGTSWFRGATDGSLEDGQTLVESLHRDELAQAVFGDGPDALAMSFTYPIRDDAGRIVGVWTNRFNWQVAADVLAAVRERAVDGGAKSTQLYLVDAKGTMLASPDPADVLHRTIEGSPAAVTLAAGASGSTRGRGLDGGDALLGYYHSTGYSIYPGLGWSVIATKHAGEALAAAGSLGRLTLIIAGIATLLTAGIAILFARTLSRPLTSLVSVTERAADGDLTVRAGSPRRDEIGRLAAGFDAMVSSLASLVGRIAEISAALASSSRAMAESSGDTGKAVAEIASAVEDVARGAERQVRMVDSARGSTDEMVAAVEESADAAHRTVEAAEAARRIAEEGVAAAREAGDAMRLVREASGEVTSTIRALGTKSEEIGGIVETITGIAGQTNLLALNAAIEAARAGEQGRGFAVVAEEVRKLAEESQAAAESISGLIAQIQEETARAVEAVEDGARRTEDGVAVVERAREAFLEIGTSVEEMTGRVESIASSAQRVAASARSVQGEMVEVAAVAEQSSAAAEQVSASTEETTAATSEVARAADALAGVAGELAEIVARFRLR